MKLVYPILTLAALFLPIGRAAHANPPGALSSWTLVWDEEFNQGGIDATKWSWGQLPWGGNHHDSLYASVITPDDSFLWYDASIGSGVLDLRCRPGSWVASNGTTYPYSEGLIHSHGKFDFAYGYSEANAQFPNSGGAWPAFWMLKDGWPPEIDIAEWFASGSRMHTGLAFSPAGGGVSWDDTNIYGGNAADGNYHAWGLDWSPGRLATYEDGKWLWGTNAPNEVPSDPMYFLLNSGVQTGTNPGWNDTHFDYVRVWKRNQYVYNGDFEHGYGPWALSGNVSLAGGSGLDGSNAMRLQKTATDGSASLTQTVYGLQPNTDYVMTGWGNVGANSWPPVTFGVQNYGASTRTQDISSNGFSMAAIPFTTGQSNTSADLFATITTTWGNVYVDNVNIQPAAEITDRSFESGDSFYYWNAATYGPEQIVSGNARSGAFCVRFDGTKGQAAGVGQNIAGLVPNTTYQLSAWSRNSWQGTKIGVKNFDGTANEPQADISADQTYSQGVVNFTTGPSNTTATIYVWFYRTNGWAYSYVDDFFLVQPFTAPWYTQDVGAPALAGAAGTRGSTIAVQGSGGDIWGTADSFRFAYQTLTGDGMITAHVRNMDSTNQFCKAGLMMRATLDGTSQHLTAHWMNRNIAETVSRTAAGGSSTSTQTQNVTTAPWVRIIRAGNSFATYYSADGSNWAQLQGPQTIQMPQTIYAGLIVNSHDDTQMNEATFDSFSISPIGSDVLAGFDQWELGAFGNLDYPPSKQLTGNGMTLMDNYLTGTDPRNPNSVFKVSAVKQPDGGYLLKWPSVPQKSYTIQYATSLTGAWLTLTGVAGAAAPATTTTYVDHPPGVQRFYRVEVGP